MRGPGAAAAVTEDRGAGPLAVWLAAWRWSFGRWRYERPGPLGLVLLGAGVPAAALILAGPAFASAASVDQHRILALGAVLAALWTSKGLADDPWRQGHIVWWLQKGGAAADFLAARIALEAAFVLSLVLVWGVLLGVYAAGAGDGDPISFRGLPARALLALVILTLAAFFSAAGASRDSELAALALLLSATRTALGGRLPGWLDGVGRLTLPPLAEVAGVAEALDRGEVWIALERLAGPLAYGFVLYVGALWLVRRRAPNA